MKILRITFAILDGDEADEVLNHISALSNEYGVVRWLLSDALNQVLEGAGSRHKPEVEIIDVEDADISAENSKIRSCQRRVEFLYPFTG